MRSVAERRPLSSGELFAQTRASNIQEAVVVGSSPRAPMLLREQMGFLAKQQPVLFIGLNAAITLILEQFAAAEAKPESSIWSIMSDWRAAAGLADVLAPALTPDVVRLWSTNVKGSCFVDCAAPLVPLRYLGDVGFSERAEWGVYSGYTVAYVAAQLILRTTVSHVRLIGVDLSYGLDSRPRFYGGEDAIADHHVLGRQIENMRSAVDRMRSAGIEITTPDPVPRWWISAPAA